jgi:hypothetical protein
MQPLICPLETERCPLLRYRVVLGLLTGFVRFKPPSYLDHVEPTGVHNAQATRGRRCKLRSCR